MVENETELFVRYSSCMPSYTTSMVHPPRSRVENSRSSRRLDSSFEVSSTKRTRGRSRTTQVPTTTAVAVADRRIDKVSYFETSYIDAAYCGGKLHRFPANATRRSGKSNNIRNSRFIPEPSRKSYLDRFFFPGGFD